VVKAIVEKKGICYNGNKYLKADASDGLKYVRSAVFAVHNESFLESFTEGMMFCELTISMLQSYRGPYNVNLVMVYHLKIWCQL
jgi:hypothetical protein